MHGGRIAAHLLMGTVAAFYAAAPAQAQVYQFSIASQSLDGALRQFARATRAQILFDSALVRDKRAPALVGAYTAAQGLDLLLRGSGLQTRRSEEGVYIVEPASTAAATAPNDPPPVDIVVTAQKRNERLLDVPVPVSVVNPGQLRNENRLRLLDYYNQVPGVAFTSDPVNGPSEISIRGLSTGLSNNPTVAFTIDDVPYGSSRADGGSTLLPEIDPGDLGRLEVLRGPQGTLYGANSLGGLVKFVTAAPSLARVSGTVSAGLNTIRNGDNPGYRLYGSANIPWDETIAVRASAFTRTSPGYIENPVRGTDNIGEVTSSGARIATLWQPADSFTANLSAFYQDVRQNGSLRAANPTSPFLEARGLGGQLGYLQQNDAPNSGRSRTRNLGFNLSTVTDLGIGDLTTISGYTVTRFRTNPDDTRDFLCSEFGLATCNTESVFGLAVPNDSTDHVLAQRLKLKKFSQEVRLASSIGDSIDTLVGVFYTREDFGSSTTSFFTDRDDGGPLAIRDVGLADFDFEELAAFANVTVLPADGFELQGGVRVSRNEGIYQGANLGPGIDGAFIGQPTVSPRFRSAETVATYLATASYKFDPSNMVYARFSTGYRPGGFNSLSSVGEPFPPYDADSTTNYEIGYKASLFDRLLTIDASIYRIDWNDIQLLVLPPGEFNFVTVNAGKAVNEGVELSGELRPWAGMALSGWVTLAKSELARDFPADAIAIGRRGDRLPISTKYAGNLSATQEFPLTGALSAYVGGTYTYVGGREGPFAAPDFNGVVLPRVYLPSYDTLDLRAGVKRDGWSADLYATNVTNARGIVFADRDYLVPIKPREIGINVSASF